MDDQRPQLPTRSDGRTPRRPTRGHVRRFATLAVAVLAATATVVTVAATATPAGASTVNGIATIASPGTTTALTSGGSTAPFTVSLPSQSACTGDTATDGYHVYSYLVPEGTDLSGVTFVGFPSTGYGLVETTGTYYGAVNTAIGTGQIIGIPNDFEWGPLVADDGVPLSTLLYSGSGATASGVWEAGLACANTSGVLTDDWNTEVTFTASSTDANGFTWSTVPGPSGSAPAAFTSASTASFDEGVAGTFTATASGSPTPVITESGTLPTGVTFSDGTISGTPTVTGSFPITLTATNGIDSPATQDFTLYVGPVVTAVSPDSGPTTGGTAVTVTGVDLADATAVDFGGTAGTIISNSATSISVSSPTGGAGTVDVTVTTAGGTSATSAADQFTYAATPTVSAVSPSSGATTGGTTVTVTGTGLADATAVDFGTRSAAIISDTATTVTVTSPTGSAGTVDVTVTTAGGTSTTSVADQFTYVVAPAVTAVSPGSGPIAGGTTVTVTGTNLGDATSVEFGANEGTVTADTATSITVTSPAGTGTVDVTVTTAAGTSATSSADHFTYVAAPTVTAVSPTSGPTDGGTAVTVTGTNLADATSVEFGTTAGAVTADTATSITVTSPNGSAGAVDVTVTTAGGTSATSADDLFTYVTAPVVTAVSPGSGPATGGTRVTVSGTNLGDATSVEFGTTAGAVTADTATSITVTSPVGTGAVDITVTTAGVPRPPRPPTSSPTSGPRP